MDLAERFAAALAAEAGAGDDRPPAARPARPRRRPGAAVSTARGSACWPAGPAASPLGASSPDAARAERLEFTVGTGPCLHAHDTGQPVFVVEDDIRRRWPAFADLLFAETPFRGIVSLPLRSP